MESGKYQPWFCEVRNKQNEVIHSASVVRKVTVNGEIIWDRYVMEEKVAISGTYGLDGKFYFENIRVNNITPYPITITKIEQSLLNNGTYNATIQGGENYTFFKSTRLGLGGGILLKLPIPVMGTHIQKMCM